MTHYIAAYDTESPNCLAACRKIVDVHRRYEMPATFFIVGRALEANPEEYKELLDNPLFEIASHTYSHRMLRDHPFCGPAIPEKEKRVEIFRGKEIVESVFQRPCLGTRPACAFDNGLKGAADVLQMIQEAGLRYVSSLAWGPDYSLPALLNEPFNYGAEGFPGVWELPAHGWHENLLKDHNRWGPRRLTLWPQEMPEAIPPGFISTPEEEFAVYRVFLEKAKSEGKPFVSLIWHPWSLHAFDPEMKMLELVFEHVRKIGLEPCTYLGLLQQISDFRFWIYDFRFGGSMDKDELKRRTKRFALRVMKLVGALPRSTEGRAIGNQLMRSGTSVGANYRAACRARSKAEFIAKLGIALEEADESAFWMELIIESELLKRNLVEPLLQEADELTAIMAASRKSASSHGKS